MSERGRLCFFAPFLYPLWSEGRIPFTGGAEVQQAQIARGLATRGFDVTVVTCDYGQPRVQVLHGVRVIAAYRQDAGLPVLRFFYPRLTLAVRALLEARADAYYVRAAGLQAGIAYDVARHARAAFVYGAAHDHDARASLPELRNPRDRWWYRRALRGADAVVAQTESQRASFQREFGVASTVVPNLVEIPAAPVDPGQEGCAVWLATYKASKRPEWFVALARALPACRFVMCGVVPSDEPRSWRETEAAARELPNLEVRGYLDHDQLGELFREASLFVHTSPAEGFPNTVLEAWAHGVPSVTVVDPDAVVARERLGRVVGTREDLIEATRALMADPAERRAAGARARAYVMVRHSADAVLERLGSVFEGAIARRR